MKRYIPFSQVAMGDTCWLVDEATGQPTTKIMRIGNRVKGSDPAVIPQGADPFHRVTVQAAALEMGKVPTFGEFPAGQVLCLDPTECVMVETPDESQAALNDTAAERAAVPPLRYSYTASDELQAALNRLPQDRAEERAAVAPLLPNWVRFMYLTQGYSHAEFATAPDLIEANREDPELVAWLRRAQVDGQSFITGGGAAPVVTFWRVA